MRPSGLLSLLLAAPGYAAPGSLRISTSPNALAAHAIDSASSWLHNLLAGAKHQWDQVEEDYFIQSEKVDMHGIECECNLFERRRH